MDSFSLYVHIPFCEKKCYYCDFISFSKEEKNIRTYIENMMKEISFYKEKLSKYYLNTIFIGGGTPSCIDAKYIKLLLEHIYNTFNSDSITEISIEANPGTLDIEKAKTYKSIGINRVSLGVQSLNDNILKSIGRIHSSKDVIESIDLLRKVGIENINVDLMFGLPHQTMDDLEDTINSVLELDIEHISLYGLIIEEGTLINKWYKKGLLKLPSEDAERYMYHKSIELLENNGILQYEISNFSKPYKQCKHNLIYWKVKPYLGVGLSSHSNLFGKRFWNYSNLTAYNDKLNNNILPIEGEESIEKDMEIAEYCILGLRLNEGIDKEGFRNRFEIEIDEKYKDIIIKHQKNGLIHNSKNNIKLTSKGLDLSNIVEVDFIP